MKYNYLFFKLITILTIPTIRYFGYDKTGVNVERFLVVSKVLTWHLVGCKKFGWFPVQLCCSLQLYSSIILSLLIIIDFDFHQ